MSGRIVGIDLGTTNCCVAVLEGGQPSVIAAAEGGRTTPSVVALTRSGERLVGQLARRQALANPQQTLSSLKRLMGRRADDPAVVRTQARVPYTIVPGPSGDAWVQWGGARYAPPQIAALLLAQLKADAEARLDGPVTQAVITVPAYFDDAQRQATKDAGRIAGLEVLRILNEPTAAALAYGLGRSGRQTIAVYDLGGGTFDLSILHLEDGLFEVRATAGDSELGGDDFDAAIMTWLLEQVQREQGVDLRGEPLALQRLKEAAEKAKIELSTLRATEIHLPFLAGGPDGPLHLTTTLTRARFEGLVAPLVAATAGPCQQALADAELEPGDIDAVLLVGGQTRMPLVQALVEEVFGQAPSRAVQPDEVVALGAAIQGAALGGQAGADVLLLDVTPLTLGVETQGGGVAALIPRNTPLPVQRTEVFTTADDDQATVEVHVVQGERPLAGENKSLARFALEGLGPGPRGAVQIAVAFTLDANGILQVEARERASGQVRAVTVHPASGLGEAEVGRMVAEAARYRAQDAAREALIEARNEADALLGQVARVVDGPGTALEAAALEELGVLAGGLEAALPTGDRAQIGERTARLRHALDALRLQDANVRDDGAALSSTRE